ncbi:MAG: hypothetical protein JXJ19_03610 [Elusimicrobia bacterium]|nr:hypothetical protein [Elusimicrobiota bacterium]
MNPTRNKRKKADRELLSDGLNKIKRFKIRLRKREILRILKFNPEHSVNTVQMEKHIQDCMESAYELLSPSVVYETFSSVSEKYGRIKEDIIAGSGKVRELFNNAVAFTVMAVTIGPGLEERINEIKDSDFTGAVILDAVGSEAVEQSANFASRIIKDEAAKQECYLSMRFSPGYGDWPIEASRRFLKYLDTSKIHVELSPEGTLIPRKSITAIQTWIPD